MDPDKKDNKSQEKKGESRQSNRFFAGPSREPGRSDERPTPRVGGGSETMSHLFAKMDLRQPMTTATAQIRADIRGNRLQQGLALWYLVFWILTGISPVDRRDWLLENFLVVVFSGL